VIFRVPATLLCAVLALVAADPTLTIYNQDFAIVRETVVLNLKPGVNRLRQTGLTALVEPDSVILRDPAGKVNLQVLEQNYLADPVSLTALLASYEGKTIDFQLPDGKVVPGKIVRAGAGSLGTSVPAPQWQPASFIESQPNGPAQPLIESEGKLRFGLPGIPLFPSLGNDATLKPTLDWLIRSDQAAKLEAELGYVSGGMTWKADYNVISTDETDIVQLIGWVTIGNRSGKSFDGAHIALMAGEVNKLQPRNANRNVILGTGGAVGGLIPGQPPVIENTFDDYHLYTLQNATNLRDGETKQVEFLRANEVATKRIYVYDGARIDSNQYVGWNTEMIRNNPEYGVQSNPKVWVMREFVNNAANHLGIPLPQGNLRFYRRDQTSRLEFTGENQIRHTPKDETVQVYTGSAFDLVGERRRVDYQFNPGSRSADETFEIRLRNHKREPADIRVVEHLYRGLNWNITIETDPHVKKDSQTAEFAVSLKPDEEKLLKYSVHYAW
jgi:hypothetical protein